jgi:hypothetical protein
MKKTPLLIALIVLLGVSSLSGQNSLKPKKNILCNVNIETQLFYKSWYEEKGDLFFVNFELLRKKEKNFTNIFSIGFIPLRYYNNKLHIQRNSYLLFKFQYTAVFGKKNHFFEMGAGLVVMQSLLNLRVGYMLNLGKRFLFRVAYTPSIYLGFHIDSELYSTYESYNGLSLGIGYRFGIQTNKEKWDNNWGWLSTVQFNMQPFFSHFEGYSGFYFTIGPEFKVFNTGDNLAVKPWIAYAYGPVYYPLYGLSTGVRVTYGKGMHLLEAGIGTLWFPGDVIYKGNYFTLQPEIGYRIRFWKRLMARVDYTPYWWFSDKEGKENIKKDFLNGVTVGVGLRLH